MATKVMRWSLSLLSKQMPFVESVQRPHYLVPIATFHGVGAIKRKTRTGSTVSMSLDNTQLLNHQDNHNCTTAMEKKPKLVIFDKNGTLINFHKIWTPWTTNLTKR